MLADFYLLHLKVLSTFISYSSILAYSVVLPMPRSLAASILLPFACFNARMIRSFSSEVVRKAKPTGEDGSDSVQPSAIAGTH